MREFGKSIKIFAPEELFPSKRAFDQLERIAGDDRVEDPVAALIDIHDKPENDFPTGMAVVSRRHIFPQLMVSGPNCGMRMMSLPLGPSKATDDRVDALFRGLSEDIHVNSFFGSRLSSGDIMDIMAHGAAWAVRSFKGAAYELDHIERAGNAFGRDDITPAEIRRAIPTSIIEISKRRMGILGKGNHFLEMHRAEKIFDEDAARGIGVGDDRTYLFMHSGSGGLGAMAADLYCPRSISSREKKMHAFVIAEWLRSMANGRRRRYLMKMFRYMAGGDEELFALEEGTEGADLYLTAIRAASNFAYANRAFIAMRARETAERTLGVPGEEVRTIYDLSHMSINKETQEGRSLWVHRVGGVRAVPSSALPEGSVFGGTGTPVFLPGSMGDATYICVATEASRKTYFSASHGAGRLTDDMIAKRSDDREELVKFLASRSVALYKGESRSIVKQDPRCFKDVDLAADYLEQQGLLKKVAKLRPIAVLKG